MKSVLFNVPNIIGYLRFVLVLAAWKNIEIPATFLPLYMISTILDVVDGWAARKLNQVSNFGALLDVAVDIFGRGVLWCHLGKYGYTIPAWEWFVFACNHSRAEGKQWKYHFDKSPMLAKLVMKNNFRTPLGTLAMSGIFILPVWIYCSIYNVFLAAQGSVFVTAITFILTAGRFLGLCVESCYSKPLLNRQKLISRTIKSGAASL